MQRIYASQLKDLGVIDSVIYESSDLNEEADTHENFEGVLERIKEFTVKSLMSLSHLDESQIVENRYQKFRNMGKFDLIDIDQKQEILRSVESLTLKQRAIKTKTDSKPSKILSFISSQTLKSPYSKFKGRAPSIVESWVPGKNVLRHKNTDNFPTRENAKSVLDAFGPDGLVNWIKNQKKVLITDTTMRDAHQSLLATRVRRRIYWQACQRHLEFYTMRLVSKCGVVLHSMSVTGFCMNLCGRGFENCARCAQMFVFKCCFVVQMLLVTNRIQIMLYLNSQNWQRRMA